MKINNYVDSKNDNTVSLHFLIKNNLKQINNLNREKVKNILDSLFLRSKEKKLLQDSFQPQDEKLSLAPA